MSDVLADQAARDRIERDLDANLIVEAAAGTGKTTSLIRRILAVISTGRGELSRIVAVTFTDKASGEMKLRLREGLERACHEPGLEPEARRRLIRAMAELEAAHIGTIHSLCADLLRERPVEAGVDPRFGVLAEDEARWLFEAVFDRWFQGLLESPPEGVRRLLRRRPRRDDDTPRLRLLRAGWTLAEQRDYAAEWRRDRFERERRIDDLVERLAELGRLAERARRPDDPLARGLRPLRRFAVELARREAEAPRDYDGLEAGLEQLRRRAFRPVRRGGSERFEDDLSHAEVMARRQATCNALDGFLEAADADLAACLHRELRPLVEAYEERKRQEGKLDFLDLLVETQRLLRTQDPVRRELQARFTHVFVDEFQDTDPLQTEILLLLAADDPDQVDWRRTSPAPGKFFAVGDPKQSIYRFRRADVATYEAVKARLLRQGASLVYLTTSFRAVPSLQEATNAAFRAVMRGDADGSQAEYVPLRPSRDEPTERPTLVALPVPAPYGRSGRVTFGALEASFPEAVGGFVHFLIEESGWTVAEEGRQVPIQSRHVCLLLRRFSQFGEDITRHYVRALESRRIRHLLVGGRSYHEREEVLAVRNALTAIEWPDDALSVYATLRGPFFSLLDDELLAFREQVGHLHPLGPVHREALGEGDAGAVVARALEVLGELHRQRNRQPLADTIGRLLQATRAHAGLADWPNGEQALANVLRIQDLARQFERRMASSFRAFVERLERSAEQGEAPDAPIVEEGSDGVRIMTVHKAKGLEFPVVVLCDPSCRLAPRTPTKWVDSEAGLWLGRLAGCAPVELSERREVALRHEVHEGVRIAYVAATRARDLLVLPAVGDGPVEGRWLEPLNPILYPARSNWRRPQTAPGCPAFGGDSVRHRPNSAMATREDSVAPGQHVPRAGRHRVVWWDPDALALEVPVRRGLRRFRIFQHDGEAGAAEASLQRQLDWQARRERARERGSRARRRIETVGRLAEAEAGSALGAAVRVERVHERDLGRPKGRRFGALVHRLLAAVELRADPDAIDALAATLGRLLDCTDDEVDAASAAVQAALAHPLMAWAAERESTGTCRREVPVTLARPDGTLAEGVVDLAARGDTRDGDEGWVVVDFKTDLEPGQREAVYRAQVALYAEAVRDATGEPARGVLLLV